jgi:hypothetical protein
MGGKTPLSIDQYNRILKKFSWNYSNELFIKNFPEEIKDVF